MHTERRKSEGRTGAGKMNLDDIIYVSLLLFSVPFGTVIKNTKDRKSKQLISSGVGALIVLLVCGVHCVHSITTTLVNCAIIYILGPRYDL